MPTFLFRWAFFFVINKDKKMAKFKLPKRLVDRGLKLSKTVFFRFILGKAGILMNDPKKIVNLMADTFAKLKTSEGSKAITSKKSLLPATARWAESTINESANNGCLIRSAYWTSKTSSPTVMSPR